MDKEKNLPEANDHQGSEESNSSQSLRLLKLIDKLGLKPVTIEGLRHSILVDDAKPRPIQPHSRLESRPGAIKTKTMTMPQEGVRSGSSGHEGGLGASQAKPMAAPRFPQPSPKPQAQEPEASKYNPGLGPLELALAAELKLRQKIEAQQDWSLFRHEAWHLYELFPQPEIAARIVDLALLYGSVQDLQEVLASLLKQDIQFYLLIDGELRQHLVMKLWQAEFWAMLDGLLFRKEIQLRLLPIERLYGCWSYLRAGESDKAYKYFRRFDREIWSAQKEFGTILKCSESELALVFGRSALQDGEENLALRLLESIPRHAAEFQSALTILLDLRIERDSAGLCPYGQKLQKELDWRSRVALIDSFLLRIQRFEASSPKERAALNDLLKDPLRWVPEQIEAWQAMAEMLLKYQAMEYLLPQVNQLFLQKSCQYHKPSFDHAIWSAIKKFAFADRVQGGFWQAVAKLHEFAWSPGHSELLLWEARQLYFEAAEQSPKPLPLPWMQLHRSLLQWVGKTERLDEQDRVHLQLLVRLIGEAKDIDEQDVHNFLVQVARPSQQVMKALQTLAQERSQWGLELFIMDRRALSLHYTNQDLARIWELAGFLKRYDLNWRVASILRNRQVFNEQLERHWQICGEKRRDYAMQELTEIQLRKIIQSFEGEERRLIEGLVAVGPVVPELLASLHSQMTPVKKPKSLSATEQTIQDTLDKITWLPNPKRIYSPNPSGLWQPKPPFFASLLESKWSLLFGALAQRLGVTAWDWQLSLLHHQIESIIPRMMRGVESPAHGKVGRWLRSLTPAQRKAWYGLAQLSRHFDDEEAQSIISRFLARLTTSLLQDHNLALQGLEKMRAPLRLRWDLERWIASETYGELRRNLGNFSAGQFAEEVYRTHALAPL